MTRGRQLGLWPSCEAVEPDQPVLLNLSRDGRPPWAVYIGRGSKWGNPFRIGRDGSRADVVARYEDWLRGRPDLLRALPELRGRSLLCFCAPELCHGRVLMRLAALDRAALVAWWRAAPPRWPPQVARGIPEPR